MRVGREDHLTDDHDGDGEVDLDRGHAGAAVASPSERASRPRPRGRRRWRRPAATRDSGGERARPSSCSAENGWFAESAAFPDNAVYYRLKLVCTLYWLCLLIFKETLQEILVLRVY